MSKRNKENRERLLFATRRVVKRNVTLMSRDDWYAMVEDTGVPTRVDAADLPNTHKRVVDDAEVLAVAASGVLNPDPGLDIVRFDEVDHPYVYNVDHYTVIERLSEHDRYTEILTTAGVKDSPDLSQFLADHVFVVGPERRSDHHSEEIPEPIKNAIEKSRKPDKS